MFFPAFSISSSEGWLYQYTLSSYASCLIDILHKPMRHSTIKTNENYVTTKRLYDAATTCWALGHDALPLANIHDSGSRNRENPRRLRISATAASHCSISFLYSIAAWSAAARSALPVEPWASDRRLLSSESLWASDRLADFRSCSGVLSREASDHCWPRPCSSSSTALSMTPAFNPRYVERPLLCIKFTTMIALQSLFLGCKETATSRGLLNCGSILKTSGMVEIEVSQLRPVPYSMFDVFLMSMPGDSTQGKRYVCCWGVQRCSGEIEGKKLIVKTSCRSGKSNKLASWPRTLEPAARRHRYEIRALGFHQWAQCKTWLITERNWWNWINLDRART